MEGFCCVASLPIQPIMPLRTISRKDAGLDKEHLDPSVDNTPDLQPLDEFQQFIQRDEFNHLPNDIKITIIRVATNDPSLTSLHFEFSVSQKK